MSSKRATSKQQDTSHVTERSDAGGASPAGQFDALADAFEASVAQCVEDAAPEAVHRTRTGSRRLQARIEAMLRVSGTGAATLKEPARAWLRPLKQIRRAAGPVRDLDVHRELLESWLTEHATSPDAGELKTHAAKLDGWLKKKRAELAHPMQKQISRRGEKLVELRQSFTAAWVRLSLESLNTPPAEAVALEDFVHAADAMPSLQAENLHEFRKSVKKARYVAESGARDTKRSAVGKGLKRIQDAIGEWHDWLCLAHEARAALGHDAPELTSAFECEVENHFASAMKTTETARGELLGEWIKYRGRKRIGPATALFIKASREASSF
jgi:CHAD domain-containing protein